MGDEHDIPEWLTEATYEELFVRGGAASLLSRPGVEAEVARVVAARGVEPRVRVLAHEMLMEAGRAPSPEVAEDYCRALPEGFAHNWWGMPGQYLERLGRTTVALGAAADACLSLLLEDARPLGYFGSEEPTLNASRRYRVRDLAAYLLAAIRGVPYEDAERPGDRDRFIEELRRSPAP
ncbi:MAG TPA: hypothetical protein VNZ44_16115 [Pyrinomonadaceae bacterium]|nr:hypothetical protein [Pyrinomonadaceae bacterium]